MWLLCVYVRCVMFHRKRCTNHYEASRSEVTLCYRVEADV